MSEERSTPAMRPAEAYANFRLGRLGSYEIVALAEAWIDEGLDAPSLVGLWGLRNPNIADVGPLFQRAMCELALTEPSRADAARFLVRSTLENLVAGKIDAVEGAEFVHDVHCNVQEDLPDREYLGDSLGTQMVECWLREIWDCRDGSILFYHADLPRDQAELKFRQYLIDAAREWLESHP